MINAYFIRYRLYGINNAIHFHGSTQYINWITVMEENFDNQFEVVEIIPYDI